MLFGIHMIKKEITLPLFIWDSYDKEGDNSTTVSYLYSACWNNDNPQVFTGKYDYDNKWTL